MFSSLPRRAATALLALLPMTLPAAALGTGPLLFRVIGLEGEVIIGLTAAEFDSLGTAPGVARMARKLVADGQFTAWQYVVGRGPDGTTRYVTTRRVAVLRKDTIRLELYSAALSVGASPAQQ